MHSHRVKEVFFDIRQGHSSGPKIPLVKGVCIFNEKSSLFMVQSPAMICTSSPCSLIPEAFVEKLGFCDESFAGTQTLSCGDTLKFYRVRLKVFDDPPDLFKVGISSNLGQILLGQDYLFFKKVCFSQRLISPDGNYLITGFLFTESRKYPSY